MKTYNLPVGKNDPVYRNRKKISDIFNTMLQLKVIKNVLNAKLLII